MSHYWTESTQMAQIRALSPSYEELPEVNAANLAYNIGRARYYEQELNKLIDALKVVKEATR